MQLKELTGELLKYLTKSCMHRTNYLISSSLSAPTARYFTTVPICLRLIIHSSFGFILHLYYTGKQFGVCRIRFCGNKPKARYAYLADWEPETFQRIYQEHPYRQSSTQGIPIKKAAPKDSFLIEPKLITHLSDDCPDADGARDVRLFRDVHDGQDALRNLRASPARHGVKV